MNDILLAKSGKKCRRKSKKRFLTKRNHAHSAGFEPARGDPSKFRVYRRNRSVTNTHHFGFSSGDVMVATPANSYSGEGMRPN